MSIALHRYNFNIDKARTDLLTSLTGLIAHAPSLRRAEDAALATLINEQLSTITQPLQSSSAYLYLQYSVFSTMRGTPELTDLLQNKNFCSYSKHILKAITPHPAFSEPAREANPFRIPALIDYLVAHYECARELIPESSLATLQPLSLSAMQEIIVDTRTRCATDTTFCRVRFCVPALVINGIYPSVEAAQTRYHEILQESLTMLQPKEARSIASLVFREVYPSCREAKKKFDAHYAVAYSRLQNNKLARSVALKMTQYRFKTIDEAIKTVCARQVQSATAHAHA